MTSGPYKTAQSSPSEMCGHHRASERTSGFLLTFSPTWKRRRDSFDLIAVSEDD